jgi:THO complex subunit 3
MNLADISEPSAAVKSFKVPGDILHIDFHPSGAHFAVTCTITLRDEAFFFRRSADSGEWEQRLDIGLGGSLGNVDSEEVSESHQENKDFPELQINSLRFSKSGKILCAVSNDGSVNAWTYPMAEVSRAPSPSAGVQSIDAAKAEDAVAGEDREEDDRKSRASTPREGSPAAEEEGKTAEPSQAEGEADAPPDDDVPPATEGEATVSGEAKGDKAEATTGGPTEDVEMAEAADTTLETVTEVSTEVDVEMTAGSSSQVLKSTSNNIDTPPSSSNAPSRQPTPPLSSKPAAAPQVKATPITCLRHTICHCASLLSLSMDPSGKCVYYQSFRLASELISRFMAIGGQDAMLSLYDTQDWICQRTFDMSTYVTSHPVAETKLMI